MLRKRGFLYLFILLTGLFIPVSFEQVHAQHIPERSDMLVEQEVYRGDYTIKGEDFAIWNGTNYIPIFIKGINMGVSVPGTQPGNLAATREDYRRWFQLIREAGFNTLRLYTLHYPRFYEELRQFNLDHPQEPLLVMHGVWIEEQSPSVDLFTLTDEIEQEMSENIDACHGNISIEHRYGKAYGVYTADISPWVVGYLPGREIYPEEVALTNEAHPDVSSFSGEFFLLSSGDPVECWLTERLDFLMSYESQNYGAVRPVGFSSWPTLDPLDHPTEDLLPGSSEDQEKIDLANIGWSEHSGGFFIGYHAYPYYPDFVVMEPAYNVEADAYGPNNYLGYLKDLKEHYNEIPLIVAEFGVPSSWGSGHHSPSGMHHGSHSEEEQGVYTLRMFDNLLEAGCAGGVQFSIIDEWFKQTWITNPFSDREYRHLWHNITSPEQNFGILTQMPPPEPFENVGTFDDKEISRAMALADYTFFRIRLLMNTEDIEGDTLWLALDTYEAKLGESILPDGTSIGGSTDTLRAEFVLRIPIGGSEADLMVLPSYDIFGIKLMDRSDTVVSVKSDLGKWSPVRWQNNYYYDQVQYIGKLKISESDDPYDFLNAVTVHRDSMEIRLPWTLINYPAPTVRRAMHYLGHDDGGTIVVEQRDTLTEGIAFSAVLNGELYQSERYSWSSWDYEKIVNEPPLERKKESFFLLKEGLPIFNSPPLAFSDSFVIRPGDVLELDAQEGLMKNDFDIDGNQLNAALAFGTGTSHGALSLHPDGSLRYIPESGFRGEDHFMYYLDDGMDYSTLASVFIDVSHPLGFEISNAQSLASIFPNPASSYIHVIINEPFSTAQLQILDITGRELAVHPLSEPKSRIDIQTQKPGVYLFNLIIDQKQEQHRILFH